MKWGYFKQGGEVVYLPIEGKIDLFVPALPAPTLMVFKNPTNNDWVVAEYFTGLKIGSAKTKKQAKVEFFLEDVAIKAAKALADYGKQYVRVNYLPPEAREGYKCQN